MALLLCALPAKHCKIGDVPPARHVGLRDGEASKEIEKGVEVCRADRSQLDVGCESNSHHPCSITSIAHSALPKRERRQQTVMVTWHKTAGAFLSTAGVGEGVTKEGEVDKSEVVEQQKPEEFACTHKASSSYFATRQLGRLPHFSGQAAKQTSADAGEKLYS